jgi:choline dehydrogenase-like flavoprotein
MALTDAQFQTLSLICDTLIPPVAADPDPDGYWRRTASDLDIAHVVAAAIAEFPVAKDRSGLAQLIGLFDNPLANLLLGGRWMRFSALSPETRERYLRDWEQSRLPLKRQGFQALKRLTGFTYFSHTGVSGTNPNWPALQYPGPLHAPPEAPKLLQVLPHPELSAQAADLDCDVVVIGSGAGGGVIAGELALAGKSVIVVEKGGYYNEADFNEHEAELTRSLYYHGGSLVTRDSSVLVLAGSCLGGGTTVNWNTSLRPPQGLRERWEHEFGLDGLASEAFESSVDAVCERVSVGTRETAVNAQNAALLRGAQALGYRSELIPRNVNGCGGGDECGYCTFGCRRGAKQGTLVTYLQDAAGRGARFIVDAEAVRVLIENGKAAGVQVRLAGAAEPVTIHARAVVAAGGSIGSPALLLRSGLTNPNIGRHLHLHPTTAVTGVYDEPIDPWHGAPQSILCNQFSDLGDGYGFALETPPLHTGLPAATLPWAGGRGFKEDMARLRFTAAFIALVKDRDAGRVSVNRSGQPLIDYRLSAYDRAHMVRGVQEAIRVHAAAGAREVRTTHNQPLVYRRGDDLEGMVARVPAARSEPNTFLLVSAHQMGTCRLGRDPQSAVADPSGQVFGVKGLWIGDASAFPSASGVNPMITIMSLAHRTAGHVRASL